MPSSKPETAEARNGLVIPIDNPPPLTEEQIERLKAKRRADLVIKPEERLTADDLRRRMAEREAAKEKPDSVEYQHSLLCALTLPRRRQESREYVREWQGRILKLSAGDLYNGQRLVPQPLPYGAKARLAFMHICTEAVKTQSRFIETERSPPQGRLRLRGRFSPLAGKLPQGGGTQELRPSVSGLRQEVGNPGLTRRHPAKAPPGAGLFLSTVSGCLSGASLPPHLICNYLSSSFIE